MKFVNFQKAIQKQFAAMSQHKLFAVDVNRDVIWHSYLSAFPEGSNPIYKTRTEHDCNCCKSFIRQVGGVVAIINNKLVSIWDVNIPNEPEYQIVANAMALYVKSQSVKGLFLTDQRTFGVDKNFERALGSNDVVEHNHFFLSMPREVIFTGTALGSKKSQSESDHTVFSGGMQDFTVDALETVLELIAQNSLYRGSEHKDRITEFLKLKKKFDKLPADEKALWLWNESVNQGSHITTLKNSAIGTLIKDLSNGESLEASVRAYERMVAPENYKRPTALVTKAMIEGAKKTVQELGLQSAFSRRFASLDDISINNLIYADRSVKKALGSVDMFDALASSAAKKAPDFGKIEEVSIEKFIQDFLTNATSVELFLENTHANNMVSLITAEDASAPKIFKWNNNFSWSYAGEVTDAVKERVKAAGGNVTGDVCCRLAWNNFDDLDLHMVEPDGTEISFRSKRSVKTGGKLDVDMNAGSGTTRTPVENIFYASRKNMTPGKYRLYVHQWSYRESKDTGFTVDIDIMGEVFHYAVDSNGRSGLEHEIATIIVDKNHNVSVEGGKSVSSSKEVWNLKTQEFVRVNAICYSPNFWDENKVGNRHYFFMLDGCENDQSARGFYNEFLNSELDKHRKVFEMLAGNNKPVLTENQLSGVGFSDTISKVVVFRVTGKTTRLVKVKF